jgi:glycosyltransferase involved in cell wall biosynthesis
MNAASTIAPVPQGMARPLWSVMIPTYNCAQYLQQTLESVLAQDPGPEQMQIEVIDDASERDDPAAVVAEVGAGRVAFYRQPKNVGVTTNFDTCVRRARGHLVHILHGDDMVRPGFYERIGRGFDALPELGAAFCRYVAIDEEGRLVHEAALEQDEPGVIVDWLERIASGQRLQTPSIAVRRAVYEQIGGFNRDVAYCEDWEMWVRIAARYPVWYEPEALAVYRVHRSSFSGRMIRSGENVRILRRVIALNRSLLPPDREARISRIAMEETARAAMRRSLRLLRAGEPVAAAAQFREAVGCSRSLRVLGGAALTIVRGALRPAPRSTPVGSHAAGEERTSHG